ncbi:protein kinase domain containing protein [Stylonychia lemnae]|uniref:non-specific serine/threonine protein kinase n=1 Tax=Stylonychia lemnae TaxID=5949 RepID=A0A078B9X1_STYLE|nr:protein kinase domain containing protein [Stylonychia lemnae]|eukprot:CDW91219.1 protein kinase domain containing protein [Stylonychia lemnae]
MIKEQSSSTSFQINKALQEIDNKNSEIGNTMSDFRIINELGRGSYGTVYKVTSLKNNQTVVLKKISLKHMKPKQQQAALKEVQILKFLDHPHIIKYSLLLSYHQFRYFTSFMEDESIHIVMEYAEKGDLYKLLKEQRTRRKYFSEKDIWDFSYQICLAVEYLHLKNIIHRDIKCLNIFLSDDKSIKIGDLGVSKIVSSAAALQDTRVGTPLYLSPELVKQQPYDFKVDVWAVGCAIYHLACLEPPFQGDNLITLGNNIVNKKHKQLPQIYSNKLSNFIDRFLAKKASERPSAREAVQLIPTFVKSAKDFKLPARRQIDDQAFLVKKTIETQNVKVENNLSLLNLQKIGNNNLIEQKDKILKKNKEIIDKKTPKEFREIKSDRILNEIVSQQKQDNNSEQQINNIVKSQSQDKISTPKLSAPLMQQKNSQLNLPQIDWYSQQNPRYQNNIDRIEQTRDLKIPLKNSQSSRFSNHISSQVALQSTNEDTTKAPSKSGVQFKIDNSGNSPPKIVNHHERTSSRTFENNYPIIQQIQSKQNQQQADQGIQKGEYDLEGKSSQVQQQQQNTENQNDKQKQQMYMNNIGREMPYLARPQTASASNNYIYRRTNQQQSSQGSVSLKPGISMLRNIANKNSQEDLIQQMQEQQQNNQYRPISAAIPQIQGIQKRKNVVFEDDVKQQDQSEIEIINDDEEGQDNDYNQFNNLNENFKRQSILQRPQTFVAKDTSSQPRMSQNFRPSTAIIPARSNSQQNQIKPNIIRASYETSSTKIQQKPTSEPLDKKNIGQSTDSVVKSRYQSQSQVTNVIKNELNMRSQQEYENQFSKFFKTNLKKTTVPVIGGSVNGLAKQITNSHQKSVINDNELKQKIKNYQTSSVQSLILQSQQDNIIYNSVEKGEANNNNIGQRLYSHPTQSQQSHEDYRSSPKENQQIFDKKKYNFPQRSRQQKKITIRDLDPMQNSNLQSKILQGVQQ